VPVSGSESGRVFGAVYAPGGGNAPPFPFNNRPYSLPPAIGASISADGSTVAWLGSTVYKQAPMLSGEDSEQYAEPLWRRIADGPEAPIRRVTGGSEPQNPACAASGETTLHFAIAEAASDPCQGPFAVLATSDVWSDSLGDAVPQLSADGYTVAFLATAQLISLGSDFGLSGEGRPSDAYVADMHPGLTRAQALRPLTELASGKQSERAATAPIVDIGVSPDGTQVAFSTERIEFPLDSLAYVSQPAAAVGMSELYDADLSNDTLTRVTGGYAGGLSEHPHVPVAAGQPPYPSVADGALSPSFSGDGSLLAFSSTASNLVYGDGNTPGEEFEFGSADGGDVFFTTRELFPAVATAGFISSAPSNPAIAPAWRIGVTSRSLANGTVRLYVQTPGAGSLSVSASGVVSVARSSAGSGRSAKPRHDATALVLRRVASAHTAAAPGPSGLLSITLSLAPRYSSLAQHRGGLTATAKVLFTSPGRPLLKQSVVVSFRRTARPKRRVRRAAARQGGVR